MTKTGFIAAVVAAALLTACSKTETPTISANSSLPVVQDSASSAAVQSLDYKLICERLTALAPAARKAAYAESCVADYQKMLPSCQNASAVNACYANLKEWSGRLACLDSCVRK